MRNAEKKSERFFCVFFFRNADRFAACFDFSFLFYYSCSSVGVFIGNLMGKRIFGELELAILRILKKDDSLRTVRDVLKALGTEDKYTTIMTVMNRLVAKGELGRKRDGQCYQYFVQSNKPRFSLFEKWRQKIFDGKSALMIGYLLESGRDITKEELAQIEQLIEQAKRKSEM